MSRLVIIGASAMGRETSAYARECGMVVKGFLDSRTNILEIGRASCRERVSVVV